MLPGIEPFTPLSVSLTMLAVVVGIVVWMRYSTRPTVQQRIVADPQGMRKTLLRHMSTVIFGLLGLLLLGGMLSTTPLEAVVSFLSMLGGMVFWGYVSALILLIMRGGSTPQEPEE